MKEPNTLNAPESRPLVVGSKPGFSLLRVLAGILAAVAAMASLWAITWDHPRLGGALMLGGFGAGWSWVIVRSLKTGSVPVRSSRYSRATSPVAYWGWLGYYLITGLCLVGAGSYVLLRSPKTSPHEAPVPVVPLVVLTAVGLLAFRAFKSRPRPIAKTFTPNLANDKEVVVEGWSEGELRSILSEFEKLYEGRLGKDFSIDVRTAGNAFHLSFPHDMPAEEFGFLVNYLHYPIGIDAKRRSILAFGKTTLTSDFNVPDASLVGQKAVLYVPANDSEHDCLYIQVEGRTFENSFTSRTWKTVSDPRLPGGLAVSP